jgi:hypothetical protein
MPRAATTSSNEQPAWQCKSARPSSPSPTDSEFTLSLWAGQRATHPAEILATFSRRARTMATGLLADVGSTSEGSFNYFISFQINVTFDFVSPRVPTRDFRAGKKLYSRQISHEGHNALPHLVRLFAMPHDRVMDDLSNRRAHSLRFALHAEQNDLRVRPCPVPHSEKNLCPISYCS